MPVNLAVKRGTKNHRRKVIVAQKRKAELDAGTLSGRVRLAQASPLQYCLLTPDIFDFGMGVLVVARGATPYSVTAGVFLLDTFALGVKDCFLRSLSGENLTLFLDRLSPTADADPGESRKLLHELVDWGGRSRIPVWSHVPAGAAACAE